VIAAAKSVIPGDSWFYYTFSKAMAIVDQYETLEECWVPSTRSCGPPTRQLFPKLSPRPLPSSV